MKLKNVITLVGLFGMSMSMLAGCDSSSGETDILDEIVSSKVLNVGTEATYPPFEYTNTKDEILGFDVEIVKLIEAKIEKDYSIDIEVKWSNMAFDGLIGAIQSDKVDLVAAGMTIDETRKKSVSFSDPYFETKTAIVVLNTNDSITSMDSLKSVKCGSQLGTEQADYIQEEGWNKDNQIVTSVADLTTSLLAGKIEALVVDEAVGKAIISKNSDLKLIETIDFDDEASFGLATKLENSEKFVSLINETLSENKDKINDLYVSCCDAYAAMSN